MRTACNNGQQKDIQGLACARVAYHLHASPYGQHKNVIPLLIIIILTYIAQNTCGYDLMRCKIRLSKIKYETNYKRLRIYSSTN